MHRNVPNNGQIMEKIYIQLSNICLRRWKSDYWYLAINFILCILASLITYSYHIESSGKSLYFILPPNSIRKITTAKNSPGIITKSNCSYIKLRLPKQPLDPTQCIIHIYGFHARKIEVRQTTRKIPTLFLFNTKNMPLQGLWTWLEMGGGGWRLNLYVGRFKGSYSGSFMIPRSEYLYYVDQIDSYYK